MGRYSSYIKTLENKPKRQGRYSSYLSSLEGKKSFVKTAGMLTKQVLGATVPGGILLKPRLLKGATRDISGLAKMVKRAPLALENIAQMERGAQKTEAVFKKRPQEKRRAFRAVKTELLETPRMVAELATGKTGKAYKRFEKAPVSRSLDVLIAGSLLRGLGKAGLKVTPMKLKTGKKVSIPTQKVSSFFREGLPSKSSYSQILKQIPKEDVSKIARQLRAGVPEVKIINQMVEKPWFKTAKKIFGLRTTSVKTTKPEAPASEPWSRPPPKPKPPAVFGPPKGKAAKVSVLSSELKELKNVEDIITKTEKVFYDYVHETARGIYHTTEKYKFGKATATKKARGLTRKTIKDLYPVAMEQLEKTGDKNYIKLESKLNDLTILRDELGEKAGLELEDLRWGKTKIVPEEKYKMNWVTSKPSSVEARPVFPKEVIINEAAPPITPPHEPKMLKIKRTEIAKELSKKLNVPIRIGHFRQKALGIYKVDPRIIRVKSPVDIETTSHEIGHYLADTLKLDKTLSKHTGELLKLTENFPSKSKTPREGFAEFISKFVTDPGRLRETTPSFAKEFMEVMGKYPEINEVLLSAREDYRRWLEMPDAAKVASHISPTPQKSSFPNIEQIYTQAVDDLYPLNKYVSVLKKKGIKVQAEKDPYVLARMHRGWMGKADTFFHHKTFDYNFNWKGKSLNRIYEPLGKKHALDDFDTYLVSKRNVDLKKRGIETGIERDVSERAAAGMEKKYPFFKEKANELYRYQTDLLDYAKESGLLSDELYNKILKLNPHYVPFYRILDEANKRGLLGKGFVNISSPVKPIKGSGREIIRPSESVVKNTYTLIDASEKNQVALALVDLSKEHPKELGRLIEKLPPKMAKVAEVKMMEEIKVLAKKAGLKDVEELEELGELLISVFRPSMFKPGEPFITVLRKGKKEFYQVDPDLYKALTFLDRESLNFMTKMLSYPARWLRLGAVSLSPEFVLGRNPMRDALTALTYSKYGFIPGIDTFRGLFSVLRQDEMYWKWKMSGAEHSMFASMDKEYLQKNLRKIIGTYSNRLKDVAKHPIDHLRTLSELTEEATRLGEFRLGMGNSRRWYMLAEKLKKDDPIKSRILEAGLASKEVTLDFVRTGAKTQAVNAIIAFWNANVQGVDKLGRQFKNNPLRTSYKIFLGITLPSVLLWLATKDDERIKELPQWQKDLFWIIPTEKHLIRIPKPFEVGLLFGTGAEKILDYIEKKDPKVFKSLTDSIMAGLNPGILPTAFLAPIEAMTNYSFFLKRPIVGESLKRLPPELQTNIYTPKTAELIGKKLNISPLKVDYFIRGYFGAMGRIGMETADEILRSVGVGMPKKPEPTLADRPVIRGLIAREPVGTDSESVIKFYDMYEKSQEGEAAIREMMKEGNLPGVKRFQKTHPEYVYASHFRKVAEHFANLRRERVRLWNSSLTPKKKREKIFEIEKEMTGIAKKVITFVEKRKQK